MSFYFQKRSNLDLSNKDRNKFNGLFTNNLTLILNNINTFKNTATKSSLIDWYCRHRSKDKNLEERFKLANNLKNELSNHSSVISFQTDIFNLDKLIDSLKSYNRVMNLVDKSFYYSNSQAMKDLMPSFVTNKKQMPISMIKNKYNIRYEEDDQIKQRHEHFKALVDDNLISSLQLMADEKNQAAFLDIRSFSLNSLNKVDFLDNFDTNGSDSCYTFYSILQLIKPLQINYVNDSIFIQSRLEIIKKIAKTFSFSHYDDTRLFTLQFNLINLILASRYELDNNLNMINRFLAKTLVTNSTIIKYDWVEKILRNILNSSKFYAVNYSVQAINIVSIIYNYMCCKLYSGKIDSRECSLDKELWNMLRNKSLKELLPVELDNRNLNVRFISKILDDYLNYFNKLVGSMSDASNTDRIKLEISQFEEMMRSFAIRLKNMVLLAQLSDFYNEQLLVDLTSECLRISEILCDSLFVRVLESGINKIAVFDQKLIFELVTVFGLFNYFDCNHLVSKHKDFEINLAKLKEINKNLYKHVKRDELMVEYQLSLLNMNIAIDDLNRDFIRNTRRLLDTFDYNGDSFKSIPEPDVVI